MSEQTYINYYIEILTATLNDVILKNVSLQANGKMFEDALKEHKDVINRLSTELESVRNTDTTHVQEYEETINQLRTNLEALERQRGEYEATKHQVQHVETFKNELVKEREEHQKSRENEVRNSAMVRELANELTEKKNALVALSAQFKAEQEELQRTSNALVNANRVIEQNKEEQKKVREGFENQIKELKAEIDLLMNPRMVDKKKDTVKLIEKTTKKPLKDGGTF